ncbi:hypothetical protein SAMD00019534_005610, partial [Acytostelium subglobosum LB1]|uniref:hypothetical protein n=1 Tax=Acytostelium subglobosum LB1 TaxID=1410327 RepID=UPI0006449C3B
IIMSSNKSSVGVIVGSSRTQRVGMAIAKWFVETSKLTDQHTVEIIDLAEWNLPLYDEAMPPMMLKGEYTTEAGKKWAAKIGSLDSFIILSPEYNLGYPAALKNAIDYLYGEWQKKPVMVVTYGYSTGGSSSNDQLVHILSGNSPIQTRLTTTRPKLFLSRGMYDEKGQVANFSIFDKHLEEIKQAVNEFTELNKTPVIS